MKNKASIINPRLIIIIVIIGLIYFGLYYTGSIAIGPNSMTTYKFYTFSDTLITYTGTDQEPYEYFNKHVYSPKSFDNDYISLSKKFDTLDKSDYVCSVTGTVTSLCRDNYLKSDRCQNYNQDIVVDGTIQDFYFGDNKFKIWGCVVDRNKVLEQLPKTFTRPLDGSAKTVGGFGFSGQLNFNKKVDVSQTQDSSASSSDNIPGDSKTSELSFTDKINLWVDGVVNSILAWINKLF